MLKMMIINIAINFHRTNPNNNFLKLHPRTDGTKPKEPFSKNLVPEKLFCIDESVNCLSEVIKNKILKSKPKTASMSRMEKE